MESECTQDRGSRHYNAADFSFSDSVAMDRMVTFERYHFLPEDP
jgi:hypothetical protein